MAIQHYKVLHDYVRANETVSDEYDDVELTLLEGELPADLKGVLFRNGNGRFAHQGVWYDHLFDGDGMISRFAFDGQRVRYRNRYVRTREFLEEEKAGRMLHRSFGTNLPGGLLKNAFRMQFKNAANTSVVWHGGHMMAMWEGGLPHRIDPVTLDTIDRYDYNGVLRNQFSWLDSQIMPELPFSAHPKIHPDTGVLHNFGTVAGTKQRLVLYEVDPQGKAKIGQVIEMDDMTFSHDFVVTQSGHRILFLTPVSFDMPRALLGLTSPAASIKVDRTKPTLILVIDPDGTIHRLTTDFCFVFHFVNGYQNTDGKLIVDGLMLDFFPASDLMKSYLQGNVADDGTGARFTRYVLDLETKQVTHRPLADYEGELPEIHPDLVGKPYQYAWGIGRPISHSRPLADQLVKIDVTTGQGIHTGPDDTLPSEPIVVPRPNSTAEDDAWLLYLLFDATTRTTDLLVADAADLTTLARLRLPHNIPLGFHGMWLPEGRCKFFWTGIQGSEVALRHSNPLPFMPFSLRPCITTLLFAVLSIVESVAQTSTPSRTYTYLIYHKLAPGKTLQDALPVEREWRAINQAAVDEGKLIGWHMMVKQMSSNPNPAEYDYVSAIVSPTMSIGGASPAALAKIYGDSVQVRMADLQRRDRATAPVVKMEIWSTIENLFGPAFSPGKTPVAVVNFMRPYDAREIWQPEVEVMKRVEIDRIKKGGVGGWTFSSLTVPAGSEKGYQLATVQCLSDLSDLVGLTPMPQSVHQTFNTVRQEVFRFMEYTVRPPLTTDKKR